jgi:purine-binding chemotaxis protein CheW
MKCIGSLVLFRLDALRFAVALDAVERFVRAVEITDLPKAPESIYGVIDVAGRVIPVFNLRKRLGLPARSVEPDDLFLIARSARREVALVVDESLGLMELSEFEVAGRDEILPGLEHFRGVTRLDDGLVFIYDIESFLSIDEARALDEAMSRDAAHGSYDLHAWPP